MEANLHLPLQTNTEEIKPKMRPKKTPTVAYFHAGHFVFSVQNVCDLACLLPQKSESEMRSPIRPKHQKIPFITGTVRTVISNRLPNVILLLPHSKCCYFVLYPVNKPKPLSPRQHAKHTSHDEASPAATLWTGHCSAQIWTWNQEEPSKSLPFIFLACSWAWQRDWAKTSATGLTVRPAFGSAGRTGTNELVSHLMSFHFFCSLHWCYIAAIHQNASSVILLIHLANQANHF